MRDAFHIVGESVGDSVEHADAVLHASAQALHHVQIVKCAFLNAETTDHLRLGLHVADVPPRAVFVEGHGEVAEELAHRALDLPELLYKRPFFSFPSAARCEKRLGADGLASPMIRSYSSERPPAVWAYPVRASFKLPLLCLLHVQCFASWSGTINRSIRSADYSRPCV